MRRSLARASFRLEISKLSLYFFVWKHVTEVIKKQREEGLGGGQPLIEAFGDS